MIFLKSFYYHAYFSLLQRVCKYLNIVVAVFRYNGYNINTKKARAPHKKNERKIIPHDSNANTLYLLTAKFAFKVCKFVANINELLHFTRTLFHVLYAILLCCDYLLTRFNLDPRASYRYDRLGWTR